MSQRRTAADRDDIIHAGPALGRVFFQHPHDRRREIGRAVGAVIGDRTRRLVEVGVHDGHDRLVLEGQLPGQHLVRHDAQ